MPPSVLAQYNSVNAQAETTASVPFQQYGGEFVAPVNSEQQTGIANTNATANEAQPYYGAATSTLGNAQSSVNPVNQAATGLAAASAEQVDPSQINGAAINQYLSPYLGDVMSSTEALQNQSNQQAQAGQLGNAITSGAFGSDRTGIAAANLQQQEDLANSSVLAGIANTGFNTALSTAQQQQGVGLSAAQANRTALGTAAQTLSGVGSTTYGEGANTASELGSLGTGAQAAGLSGAQAQIAAGTVQQQTQQAQDTAQYNQFLQQQSYPFQVDQFLANIAEGTGALSGSTTTTQQPGGFFSDEHLKEDMEPVGKTFDGQTIYRYKIKGDSRDRIGLSAQKVEKKHPDAVGVAGGYRYVDYGKATEDAANRGHFYAGGVVPMRRAYAYGGSPADEGGLGAVLQAQQQMYGGGPNSQQQRNISGVAPASHQLAVASGSPAPPPSGSSKVSQTVGLGKDAYQGYKYLTKPSGTPSGTSAPAGGATPANNYAVGIDPNATYTAPPNYSEGLTGDWQASAAPGGHASGVAGADASAAPAAGDAAASGAASGAADAAGTGAADAAGAGAAEAGAGAAAGAGAGAAAGAAGAAAGAGAADAAAAIAAEYAAADVAAAAIIAAKRGGAIRGKFDAGGSPYSTNGDDIDIPDEQTSAKLQQAGPLVKQPTGLQTAMKMGDPNQASSLAGSMFSNEALARGGVAGRRGYDDGGAPSDDETPDVASYGPAVMDADSAPSGGVAGNSDEPSLWDKVKKHATAENVVPILTGLAAMGTAKTRSPGVALAAGLGAGSQSYLDTRKSLADTANEQAHTQAVDIANQLATMKNKMIKDYQAPSTPIPGTPAAPTAAGPATAPVNASQKPADPAAVAQKLNDYYKSKYQTTPWLPDEQAALKKARGAAIALNSNQPVDDATAAHDQRVQNQTYANQKSAQVEADQLYKSATSDPDPVARNAATAKYNAIFQWTGDKWDDKEGNRVNSRTGAPAIGVAKQTLAPTGDIVTDAYGQKFRYNQQTNTLAPIGVGGAGSVAPSVGVSPTAGSAAPTFQQPVADQAHILQDIEGTRANTDVIAPTNRNINQHLLQLSKETATGPLTQTVQKLAGAAGLPSGSQYQQINAYLNRQAAISASAMGVPHTNAGLAASQSATGTTEYVPTALQEKVKFSDALNTGAMAYRQGLDKAIGTGPTPDLTKYQAFRSAWSRNFDPDVFRIEDAKRRGDDAELDAIRNRLGVRGVKTLKQKSSNLWMLENGKIPQ